MGGVFALRIAFNPQSLDEAPDRAIGLAIGGFAVWITLRALQTGPNSDFLWDWCRTRMFGRLNSCDRLLQPLTPELPFNQSRTAWETARTRSRAIYAEPQLPFFHRGSSSRVSPRSSSKDDDRIEERESMLRRSDAIGG